MSVSPTAVARALFLSNARTAIVQLVRATNDDEQVHRARKALKCARAGLRLLRLRLGESTYSRENRVLRDAARRLSELRDTHAAMASLDLLRGKARDHRSAKLALENLRPLMEMRLSQARKDHAANTAARQQCIDGVRGSLRRIGAALKSRGEPYYVAEALKRTYRNARKAYRRAKDACNDETLHEWRKQTKYLWASADALQKSRTKNLRHVAKRAKRITDRLGDDHDLAVLGGRLANLAADNPSEALRPLIERRRAKWQRHAFEEGAKLFSYRPRDIVAGLQHL